MDEVPTASQIKKDARTLYGALLSTCQGGMDSLVVHPEVWITELEDLCMRLEDMGSSILDNQFMIHMLNNLTSDYELQFALMEKRVGDTEKPLTIEEIKAELILCFERLDMYSNGNKEGGVLEEYVLFTGTI
jgi:hypothetical protein